MGFFLRLDFGLRVSGEGLGALGLGLTGLVIFRMASVTLLSQGSLEV